MGDKYQLLSNQQTKTNFQLPVQRLDSRALCGKNPKDRSAMLQEENHMEPQSLGSSRAQMSNVSKY